MEFLREMIVEDAGTLIKRVYMLLEIRAEDLRGRGIHALVEYASHRRIFPYVH